MQNIIVSILATTALILANWPVAAFLQTENINEIGYQDAIKHHQKGVRDIENFRSHIDRSQFDLDALNDRLEFDAENIIRFVKKEIRFEQYPGSLRGARGTLMSRAGNALDQAVLLANLLHDAGFDARIVAATLTDQQTEILLQQMKNARSEPPPIGNLAAMRAVLQNIAEDSNVTTQDIETFLNFDSDPSHPESKENVAQVRTETDFVLNILEQNGVTFESGTGIETQILEAKEYFFVEFREGAISPWRSVHPSISAITSAFDNLTATAYFGESIPEKFQHKFGFEVLLTTENLGHTGTQFLIPMWERPVANLVGVPLTYTNVSKNMLDSNFLESGEIGTAESDLFLPAFNGDIQANGLDLQGNIIPADAAASMFAAVFQTVSTALNRAAQALSDFGLDSTENAVAVRKLKSVEIRYSLIQPNRETKEFVRTIFDSTNLDVSGDYIKTLQLLSRHYTIAVGGGAISRAYVVDQYIADLLDRRAVVKAVIDYRYQKIGLDELRGAIGGISTNWIGHPLLELIQGSINESEGGLSTYMSGPSIVVHYRELPLTDSAVTAIDVVSRNHATRNSGSLEYSPSQQVQVGVWETLHEGSLLGGSEGAYNTKNVFDRARANSGEFVVVKPSQKGRLSDIKMPPVALKNVRRDLNNGYVLIMPKFVSATDDPRNYAWWRVDPKSGETLGISGTGEGMDAVAYITLGLFVFGALLTACIMFSPEMRRDPNNANARGAGWGGVGRCVGLALATSSGAAATYGWFALRAKLGPLGMILASIALLNWSLSYPDPQ